MIRAEVGHAEFHTATHELERGVVGALLFDPSCTPSVLEKVSPEDFLYPAWGIIMRRLKAMYEDGISISLPTLGDELFRNGELSRIGGAAVLGELFDAVATSALVECHARRVRVHSRERQLRNLLAEAAENPRDLELRKRVNEVWAMLDEVELARIDLDVIGCSGARLRALRDRPELASPLPGVLDPEPHLHLLSGKPKSGKTTFALNLTRAWCQGIRPWRGTPALPASRALVISLEQPVRRLDQVLRRLSVFSDCGSIEKWTDKLAIVARDRDLRPEEKRLLTLDDAGLAGLSELLRQAQRNGDPFGFVVLDSLSRLKPRDVEESDNDGMAHWLDRLEDIAVECGVYIILIHHVGHTAEAGRREARSAPRGASAIAAVPQVLWLLERVSGSANQRLLKVDGNAILPDEITFEVCGEEAEAGSIHYFQQIDPLDAHDIDDLLEPDEEITTSGLAWRTCGKRPKKPKERPPGAAQKIASALRRKWDRERLIEAFDGPGGAKMIRRRNHAEVERA